MESLIKEIQEWLEDEAKDISAGVALLKQLGPKQIGLARRVGKNPHKKFHSRIVSELANWLKRKNGKAPVKAKPAAPAPKASASAPKAKDEKSDSGKASAAVQKMFSPEEFDKLPQDVKDLVKENDKTQKMRANTKAKLEGAKDKQARKKLADAIVSMTETITDNFAQLEYFKKHGELPKGDVTSDEEGDLVEVQRKLRNARSNRSKAKSSAKNAKTEATKTKHEAKFKELDAEVIRLEKLEAKLQDESVQNGEGK